MPNRERKRPKGQEWRHVENKKLVYTVYFVLRLSVVLMLVAQFFNQNYENVLLCVLTLVLFMLPSAFERRLHIDLPDTLEIIILLFIYAAEILGEIQSYYTQFRNWDTMLHTMNGFLCAAIGFALVDILNREEKVSLHLSPFFMAVTTFCFSMTIGVLWEFFEFSMDQWLLFDMQKDTVLNTISTVKLDPNHGTTAVIVKGIQDVILVLDDGTQMPLGLGGYLDVGIVDTMKDLFVNFIGAVVFSTIGFFYVKGRGKGNFATRFIPRFQRRPAAQAEAGPEASQQVIRNRLPLWREKLNKRFRAGAYFPWYSKHQDTRRKTTMINQTNPSIKCTVNSCAHHKDQRCTLNEIQVGHCQSSVCDCKETECASFKLGDHGTSCGCH